ncbi:MAG: hypothetical protein ACYDHD_11600, partial [Vulcanimicrobiaceae bacterium]
MASVFQEIEGSVDAAHQTKVLPATLSAGTLIRGIPEPGRGARQAGPPALGLPRSLDHDFHGRPSS